MRLPQLQITSQSAVLGIRTEWGVRTIHSERAEVSVHTKQPHMDVQSHRPVMNVDQSATWDAINGGKLEGLTKRLVSQTTGYVQQYIQATNDKWRTIADLAKTKANPIPDLAYASISREKPELPVFGPASRLNTRIEFSVQKPDIQVQPGKVSINVVTNQQPDIQFTPGKVHYTIERYPKVTVTPPSIVDLMV